LNTDATSTSGCEFLPAVAVAAPVAGWVRAPRTVSAPFTSSVTAGVAGGPPATKRIYRFGLFQLDPEQGELLRQGKSVKLQEQLLRVLCLLVDRAGDIVSREELRRHLWPDGTYVEFEGSLNAILKRLRSALGDSADNPVFVETVPKRGYRLIAPVSVDEAAEMAGTQTLPTPRTWEKSWLWAGIGALAFLIVVGGFAYLRQVQAKPNGNKDVPATVVTPRRALAVLAFLNVSGRPEDDWLSTAVSEILSTELAAGEKLRLVSGEEVVQLHLTMPWSQTSTLSPETTARIGSALNSDLLVLGSYIVTGTGPRQLRIDVRLQDSKSGQVLEEVTETGTDQHLLDLVAMVSGKLRQRLELPTASVEEDATRLALLSANMEAERAYSIGLLKMREYDYLSAKDLPEQAVKADPKFSLGHSILARAWEFLGYIDKAKSESKMGLDLSQGLPRTNRMLAGAAFYQASADRAKGADLYRALYAMFPDNLDYGLQLSKLELDSYHNDQAMETLRQLRALPAPLRDDPRIDLRTAWTLYYKDRGEALVFARSAARKAAALERRLIYAKALQTECDYDETHSADAAKACDESYQIFIAAGNSWEAAWVLVCLADRQRHSGDYVASNQLYERAIQIVRPMQAHQRLGAVLNNYAINVFNQGQLDRAESVYREALQNFQAVGDRHNTGVALANIADILALRGRLDEAAAVYRQAWENTEVAVPQPGYAHYRYALVRLAQGKPEEALREAELPVEASRKLNKIRPLTWPAGW
jgi:eukaryotic-like serine/threonine-protein kinase